MLETVLVFKLCFNLSCAYKCFRKQYQDSKLFVLFYSFLIFIEIHTDLFNNHAI